MDRHNVYRGEKERPTAAEWYLDFWKHENLVAYLRDKKDISNMENSLKEIEAKFGKTFFLEKSWRILNSVKEERKKVAQDKLELGMKGDEKAVTRSADFGY